MCDTKPPNVLSRLDLDLRQRLVEQWGEALVNEAERRGTLIHLDWCWSDHLAHAAEIRENIHLASFNGFNPQDLFSRQMNFAFREFRSAVEEKTLSTLRSATFTSSGVDLEKEGLRLPSSTWTFMVNDNPRGAVLNILIRGTFGRLKKDIWVRPDAGKKRYGGAIVAASRRKHPRHYFRAI